MTKEQILHYLTTESMRAEEVGGYALSMFKDDATACPEAEDPATFLAICSRVSEDFHKGLGAMTLAFLSRQFPDTPEAELRLNKTLMERLYEDFRQNEAQLAKMESAEARVDFAMAYYDA